MWIEIAHSDSSDNPAERQLCPTLVVRRCRAAVLPIVSPRA